MLVQVAGEWRNHLCRGQGYTWPGYNFNDDWKGLEASSRAFGKCKVRDSHLCENFCTQSDAGTQSDAEAQS